MGGLTDAPGSVGLYPGFFRKKEALQVLAEVFHHVIAFKFSMDENIQSYLFLQGNAFFNPVKVELPVLLPGNEVLPECRPVGADFRSLGEGTYCRRRKQGKAETGFLKLFPLFKRRESRKIARLQGEYFRLDSSIFSYPVRLKQSIIDLINLFWLRVLQRKKKAKVPELLQFFFGKREVFQSIFRQFRLLSDRIGNMQKGAGSPYAYAGTRFFQIGQQRQSPGIMIAPDILPVDDACKKKLIFRETIFFHQGQRLLSFHKIQSYRINIQSGNLFIAVADISEVGLKNDLHPPL